MAAKKPDDITASKDVVVTPFGVVSVRRVPMKVIVCGLGRTGTASMKTALEILGFPAYHAFDLWKDSEENIKRWNNAIDVKYNGKGTVERNDWDQILGNYLATVDAPSAFFAPELAAAYPDAKVIILNREPEAWFRSCQAAFGHRRSRLQLLLYRLLFSWDNRLQEFARHGDRKQADVWGFEWHDGDARGKALRFFDEYYAECRARIPEGRRLEFRVQDGWEPLCHHLGVPIPTVRADDDDAAGDGTGDGVRRVRVPFPWTNDAAEFNARVAGMVVSFTKDAVRAWAERIFVVGSVWMFVRMYWP